MGGKSLYVPKPFAYKGRRQRTAENIASGLAGAGGMALAKYAYDKMFKKPVNVAKAVGKAIKPFQQARLARRPGLKGKRGRKSLVPVDEGTGGYSQWTQRYQQARFGSLTPKKIDKLSNDIVIFRHQRIGAFNDYGQRFMYHATDSATPTYCMYPLVLFELNSVNNYVSGTQTYMSPVHQMIQTSANQIGWTPLETQIQTGALSGTNWIIEKSGHTGTSVSSHPMDKSIHKWTSLDLELWGQTAKPTMYTIYLCQLHEDVVPPTKFTGAVGSYDNITDTNAIEFWQSMVKRYTFSPLAKMDDGYNTKKIKILRQYKVNIDPTATYENDPDPHVKTFKMFYRFNRQCNFQWKFSNGAPQSINDMVDADYQQEDGENQVQVHPNARLFVMIRASNFQRQQTLAAATNANTPSISWVFKSAHLVNQ